MTSDHRDRDTIPLPEAPMDEPASGAVVRLRRPTRPPVPAAALAVSSFGEVAAAGEPRWLIQGLWPADAYGVLAAQEKAGKTWAALDLAVSVATGRPWLDHFACPGLRLDLERYLRYYDTERAHTGRWTNGRTPQTRSSGRQSCGTRGADASPQLGGQDRLAPSGEWSGKAARCASRD